MALPQARGERDATADRQRTAQVVLAHLQAEEEAAEKRLEQLRLEVEVLRGQTAEQAAKCRGGSAREAEEAAQQAAPSIHTARVARRCTLRA